MGSGTPPSPVPLDDHGMIAADAPCIRCQYNLRGLGPDVNCPECGTAAEESISAPLLRCEDPHWLRRICLGLTLVALATAGVPVVIGITAATSGDYPAIFGFGVLLLTFVGGIGVWAAARPRQSDESPDAPRYDILLRMVVLPNALAAVFVAILSLSESLSRSDVAGGGCALFYVGSFGLLTVSFLLYLRWLLGCALAHNLARWAGVLAGGCGLASGLLCVAACQVMGGAQHSDPIGFCSALVGLLLGALSLLGTLVLLVLARSVVGHERRTADAWRAQLSPPTEKNDTRQR